jgi:DNA-binding transcriptional regulator YdaS (Cro superfamily)
MNLSDHVKRRGGTAKIDCPVLADIAGRAGCKPSTLYMIAGGHKRPSWRLAESIEGATDGVVTRNELRPDIFGAAVRRRRKAA